MLNYCYCRIQTPGPQSTTLLAKVNAEAFISLSISYGYALVTIEALISFTEILEVIS